MNNADALHLHHQLWNAFHPRFLTEFSQVRSRCFYPHFIEMDGEQGLSEFLERELGKVSGYNYKEGETSPLSR